jgi:MoaA/NifB/PqqE/SkfB family radical SAM enzyme
MGLAEAARLLPRLAELHTKVVLISGGEPLLNPQWGEIAALLRSQGLRLWLLTSGLSLAKHARRAVRLFEAITVSLDGTTAESYAAIRGVDAFDKVCEGIRAAADAGTPVGVRVTVQRANYSQLPQFVVLARELGAQQISFVAADVAITDAFGRVSAPPNDVALQAEDLPIFEQVLQRLERERAGDFDSGLIADSPRKLQRMHQYFRAVCGQGPYPPVRCNVFDFSAVITAAGHIRPCYFIPGPALRAPAEDLSQTLNSESMIALRNDIRAGARPECARCVCSLWREPDHRAAEDFLMRRNAHA